MGEISIKINIADRLYPLKIEIEEEELIRKAAKNINEQIRVFQDKYAVKDKQDLLSMAVLHYATEALKSSRNRLLEDDGISEKAVHIDRMLAGFLSKQ